MTTDLKQQFAAFRQQAAFGFRNKRDRDGEQLAICALLKVCTALTEEVEALANELATMKADALAVRWEPKAAAAKGKTA